MSVNRLFLRTAAVAALTPADDDIYPVTMAGVQVYDSRLDPIEHLEAGTEMPIIAVYTDDDDYSMLTLDSSGMRERTTALRIEFAIATFDTIERDGSTYRTVGYPAIDAELEARLDLFEQQITDALFRTVWRPGTVTFLKFVKRVDSVKSVVTRDEEGGNRIASRMLNMHVCMPDDCPPTIGVMGQEQKPIQPKFDSFPGAPWLSDLLNRMASTGVRHPALEVLGNARTAVVYLPLLERIGFKVDAVEPEADPERLAKLGKTHGPDGRIEVEGVLEINK